MQGELVAPTRCSTYSQWRMRCHHVVPPGARPVERLRVVIDDGLPEEWDPRVREASLAFKQGHLVAEPPFLYVAAAQYGLYSLTREFGDPAQPDEIFESEQRPPYGLITTETCDLSEEDARKPRHAWVSVAPVYDLSGRLDESQIENLRSNRVGYMR